MLYFENLSRDSSDAYLAEGLTEEIISRLGQVTRLVVKSRHAVERFRRRPEVDPAELGRALGVTYLVSGSVQRAGPKVRVRVELVKTAAGTRLWGQAFDRTDRDLLAIEDDIAQVVAGEVVGRLAPVDRAVLTARPTHNMAAYDHYLKGNFYLSRRTGGADVLRARDEYRSALRLDPGFAAAFGRLGLAYGLLAGGTSPGSGRDSLMADGLAAANRAIALDSASTDGWLARGFLLAPAFDCPSGFPDCLRQSMEAVRHAVRLAPRDAEALYQLGRASFIAGKFAAADSALVASLTLEPDRAVAAWLLGWLYFLERRFERARAMLDSAIALGRNSLSTYVLLMDVKLAQLGDHLDQADIDSARAWLLPDSISYATVLIIADARRGDSTTARARLDTLLRSYPLEGIRDADLLLSLAASLIAVGSFDQSLSLLERLPRNPFLWLWLQNPRWDAVRQDPRFRQIEAEVKPSY